MDEKFRNLPLRSGVGIVILNKENKIFVAKRIDNPKNFWQMPQGGVDKDEDFLSAAYRELEEETSIKDVELIKEIDEILTYELPKHLLGIIWKGKYKGQKQKWFIMRYLGTDDKININTKKPEFLEWKWIDLDMITEVVVDFKLEVYKKLKSQIKEIDKITTYLLPKNLLGVIWKGKYKGQKQKWFLMRFLGSDNEININTNKPEFLEWKWIDLDMITEVVVDFKLEVYKTLQKEVKSIIN